MASPQLAHYGVIFVERQRRVMTETKKNSLSRALEAWFSTAILKKDMA
jgi:hypothetical protein